jgi:hypothetical protein
MGRSFAAVASWEPLSTFTTSGVAHHQPLEVAMEARFVQLSPSVEMETEEPTLALPTPRREPPASLLLDLLYPTSWTSTTEESTLASPTPRREPPASRLLLYPTSWTSTTEEPTLALPTPRREPPASLLQLYPPSWTGAYLPTLLLYPYFYSPSWYVCPVKLLMMQL